MGAWHQDGLADWPTVGRNLTSTSTAKYGLGSAELRPMSDCSGKAQKQLYE
jgi:hypothetical protein